MQVEGGGMVDGDEAGVGRLKKVEVESTRVKDPCY